MSGPQSNRHFDKTDNSQSKDAIAVLPFRNASSEKELDYICEGIAEEVIDRLTRAEGRQENAPLWPGSDRFQVI